MREGFPKQLREGGLGKLLSACRVGTDPACAHARSVSDCTQSLQRCDSLSLAPTTGLPSWPHHGARARSRASPMDVLESKGFDPLRTAGGLIRQLAVPPNREGDSAFNRHLPITTLAGLFAQWQGLVVPSRMSCPHTQ